MPILKTIDPKKITQTKTLIHEYIPITGSLTRGTYGTEPNEENIKNYTHGLFQTAYDYPYLSSSANQMWSCTFGYSTSSVPTAVSQSTTGQRRDKGQIYNQMSLMTLGTNVTGAIQQLKQSGSQGGSVLDGVLFVDFSRLLTKDAIAKKSMAVNFGTGSYTDPMNVADADFLTLQDFDGDTNFYSDSPAGQYGFLKQGSATGPVYGIVYYDLGLVQLDISGAFAANSASAGMWWASQSVGAAHGSADYGYLTPVQSYESASIQQMADGFRHYLSSVTFNNTTELNSTIYFCEAGAGEYNYSSNPTYLSASSIIIKEEDAAKPPWSAITTVGLYSAAGELYAVAKTSEPLKKTPQNELTLRVRLDY